MTHTGIMEPPLGVERSPWRELSELLSSPTPAEDLPRRVRHELARAELSLTEVPALEGVGRSALAALHYLLDLLDSKGTSESALAPIKRTVLRRLETTERARLAKERPTFRQELAAFLATVDETLEDDDERDRPSRRLRRIGL